MLNKAEEEKKREGVDLKRILEQGAENDDITSSFMLEVTLRHCIHAHLNACAL